MIIAFDGGWANKRHLGTNIPLYLLGEFFISSIPYCRAIIGYTCVDTFVQPAQVQDYIFSACSLPEEYTAPFPQAIRSQV